MREVGLERVPGDGRSFEGGISIRSGRQLQPKTGKDGVGGDARSDPSAFFQKESIQESLQVDVFAVFYIYSTYTVRFRKTLRTSQSFFNSDRFSIKQN